MVLDVSKNFANDNLKKSNVNKVNQAFIEDEAIRKAAIKRSQLYVEENDKNETPYWVWAVAWFCIGVIFATAFIDFNWIQYFN